MLFDEADVAAGLTKAVPAAGQLGRISAAMVVEAVVADLAAASSSVRP